MRFAALNTGPDVHLLDHIAPLAEIVQMPLIIEEEKNLALAKTFYPQVKIEFRPHVNLELERLARDYDALFECKYWRPQVKPVFRDLYGKKMRLFFCPHGMSDKGFTAPLLAPYAEQDIVLLYGERLIEMLKELKIWPHMNQSVVTGNYRATFYARHQAFYDRAAEIVLSRLVTGNRTLLYAPTWKDADEATSFFSQGQRVIDHLPPDWNLVVKPHPLLEQRNPELFYRLASKIEEHPHAVLLTDFPPVYPILARADVFLGDVSSVGYDFLHFQRPMFFFPGESVGRLHSCGAMIPPEANLYAFMERHFRDDYSASQKVLYRFAFGDTLPVEELRSRICKAALHGD